MTTQYYTLSFGGLAYALSWDDGVTDGTPELPREFIDTTYSLPTGGTTWYAYGDEGANGIYDDGTFQQCMDAASLGDVIVLKAGSTYTGNFKVPIAVGTGWIYVISSDLASLPEGTRVVSADSSHMPTVRSTNTTTLLTFQFNANHWRFAGINFTTDQAITVLILAGYGYDPYPNGTYRSHATLEEQPSYITFDRCIVQTTSEVNGLRCGYRADGRYMAIIECRFANIKAVSESQAIHVCGGAGPYRITNNYLESAGENILFGGDGVPVDELISSDIEFRQNYCFKKPEWEGTGWEVKNQFELKNAKRVWVSGNIFENVWADGQVGTAILFTPRNQYGADPWNCVQDVTFENNVVRNCVNGFNILSEDTPTYTSDLTMRILIRNNILDQCKSSHVELNCGTGKRPTKYLTIVNNLFLHPLGETGGGSTTVVGKNTSIPNADIIVVKDNIMAFGDYGFNGLLARTTNLEFSNNCLIMHPNDSGYANWSGDSYFAWQLPIQTGDDGSSVKANTPDAAGFTDWTTADYTLAAGSPFLGIGTNGSNPGPDFTELNAALVDMEI